MESGASRRTPNASRKRLGLQIGLHALRREIAFADPSSKSDRRSFGSLEATIGLSLYGMSCRSTACAVGEVSGGCAGWKAALHAVLQTLRVRGEARADLFHDGASSSSSGGICSAPVVYPIRISCRIGVTDASVCSAVAGSSENAAVAAASALVHREEITLMLDARIRHGSAVRGSSR
jgi:hypothetical protein